MSDKRTRLLADAALIVITAIWGATFVSVKSALARADTFTFLALRFSLGAAVGLALSWRQLADARVWKRGAVLGVILFVGYALQTAGLETTAPARSAFITGLTVVFVPFWSVLILSRVPKAQRRQLGPRVFASVLLAVLGLGLLTGVDLSQPWSFGDALTLLCTIVYALHIALTGVLSVGVAPMAFVSVQLLVTALLSAGSLVFVDRHFESSTDLWLAVFLTGVIASTFAIAVQAWAQARTTAARAAIFFALEPVFAVLTVVAIGGGWPSSRELAGGAVIMAALLVSREP